MSEHESIRKMANVVARMRENLRDIPCADLRSLFRAKVDGVDDDLATTIHRMVILDEMHSRLVDHAKAGHVQHLVRCFRDEFSRTGDEAMMEQIHFIPKLRAIVPDSIVLDAKEQAFRDEMESRGAIA